jgi:hypothetical protein
MFSIAQTAEGFLWFSSPSHDIYRFDGIRFVPWPLPHTFRPNAMNLGDDRNAGTWAITERGVTHVKGEIVASDFERGGAIACATSLRHGPFSVNDV